MTFLEFLEDNEPWDGPEGEFVSDTLALKRKRPLKSWHEVKWYLEFKGCRWAIRPARNVWEAYQAALDDMLLV
ncbi:hypothetical protein B6V75_08980 [Thioclava sp. F1Mire-8]|nr:hypothetical protein B6V75_08980 [Thioclava sp. F1Mire-8]